VNTLPAKRGWQRALTRSERNPAATSPLTNRGREAATEPISGEALMQSTDSDSFESAVSETALQ